MLFTWKKGFGELAEKVKSQSKMGSRKMNLKGFIGRAAANSKFLEYLKDSIHYEEQFT